MAVTKIIPIHFTIDKSVSYICNPDKTTGGLFIHSEHCVPETAALTFQHHLQEARSGGNTVGRHLIQSFAPGEVDPETAHEIGKKLAGEILGGKYAYVLATHVDRGHIHNHFVWGAADVETHKKYHSNKRSYHEIRDASDRLCAQYDLSVIVPKGTGKSLAEYHTEKQGMSWKAKLKKAIDLALFEADSYDGFLRKMEANGYEVKHGVNISFRAAGQTRFTRGKTLGDAYMENALRVRAESQPLSKKIHSEDSLPIRKIIDIEGNEKIQSSPGYRQWATIFNLKQSAAAFNQIQQYGGINAFDEVYQQLLSEKLDLAKELNGMDASIKSLTELRNQLRAYVRTKAVYQEYRSLKTPKQKEKYFKENETDIQTHRIAKKILSQIKKPLPSAKAVTAEISQIQESRKALYVQYNDSKKRMQEADILRKNLYSLMNRNTDRSRKHDSDLFH